MNDSVPTVDVRAAALVSAFREVEATRMAGLPVLHPRLRVEGVGFERVADEPSMALGVLVTPWFMNLVRLPLDVPASQAMAAVGERCKRTVETLEIEFLGSDEASVGRFEACSLFSPMAEFADQGEAVATARAVLAELRAAAVTAKELDAPKVSDLPKPGAPDRRGFLFGRR